MLLGTRNPTEQASVLYGWVRRWRTGETACPIAPPVAPATKEAVRAAKLDFLTWKLGRKDLAVEASRLLRQREATYKAAQRNRIERDAGEDSLKWHRGIEQQVRRLIERAPLLRRTAAGKLKLRVSHRFVDVSPKRYWLFVQALGGPSLFGLRRRAIFDALTLATQRASIESFSPLLQRAYASYFWTELWACA